MDALGMLKFWRNGTTAAGADSVKMDKGKLKTLDDEETDDDESFFDLAFKSPDCAATASGGDGEAAKEDLQLIEPLRDFCMSKTYLCDSKPSSRVTPLQPTSKSRVFKLAFNKTSKYEKTECTGDSNVNPLNQFSKSSKIEDRSNFADKCRKEERPICSILSRDNSLKSKPNKETSDHEISPEKSSTHAVQKYANLIKPLYEKVSKRYNDAAKFSEDSTLATPPANSLLSKNNSRRSRMGNFKTAKKILQKSRSASAATDMVPPPASWKDDSLLEQHDGIRGAILHCKKSYNSIEGELVQK